MLNFVLPAESNRLIKDLIDYHKNTLKPRYDRLMDYYLGNHAIAERVAEDGKPNNKISNPFPDSIVTTVQGYLLGQPVQYVCAEAGLLEPLKLILDRNNEQDHNLEMLKTISICGEAFELVYLDEDAQICFTQLPNTQTIAVYDDSLKPCLQVVLRYYEVGNLDRSGKPVTKVELYWTDRTEYFSQHGTAYVLDETKPHYFGSVPVVHYINNKETTGDFEKIIPLINDYDKILSDNSNELEYFRNAYMVLKGFGDISDEDLRKFRKAGAFLLPGVSETEDVDFITKNLDNDAVMSQLETLEKNIHKFSHIPNLTDENFAGNLSGVAIKYKLWGFEQLIGAKERKFSNGLYHRLKLIAAVLNLKGDNFQSNGVQIKFSRNLPANLLEESQVLMNLKDVLDYLPLEELFARISFIEDPQTSARDAEKKQKATEQRETTQLQN